RAGDLPVASNRAAGRSPRPAVLARGLDARTGGRGAAGAGRGRRLRTVDPGRQLPRRRRRPLRARRHGRLPRPAALGLPVARALAARTRPEALPSRPACRLSRELRPRAPPLDLALSARRPPARARVARRTARARGRAASPFATRRAPIPRGGR